MYMCVCLCGVMCMCVQVPSKARDIGGCKLPNMGAEVILGSLEEWHMSLTVESSLSPQL